MVENKQQNITRLLITRVTSTEIRKLPETEHSVQFNFRIDCYQPCDVYNDNDRKRTWRKSEMNHTTRHHRKGIRYLVIMESIPTFSPPNSYQPCSQLDHIQAALENVAPGQQSQLNKPLKSMAFDLDTLMHPPFYCQVFQNLLNGWKLEFIYVRQQGISLFLSR